jgi:SAM-dependent methyltransferase
MTDSKARDCGDVDVAAGRAPTQLGWYAFATRFVAGKTVLDIGCGLGDGLAILRRTATLVRGQDLDPRLAAPDRLILPIAEIPDRSYDVVVSIDVIEHVEDPPSFLGDCARIACEGFFLSTPNWSASRCAWPYHLREYTPEQFEDLLKPYGDVTLFKGDSPGDEVYPIQHRWIHHRFNDMRNWDPTYLPSRVINRLLPRRYRIFSSNAAWVKLGVP